MSFLAAQLLGVATEFVGQFVSPDALNKGGFLLGDPIGVDRFDVTFYVLVANQVI